MIFNYSTAIAATGATASSGLIAGLNASLIAAQEEATSAGGRASSSRADGGLPAKLPGHSPGHLEPLYPSIVLDRHGHAQVHIATATPPTSLDEGNRALLLKLEAAGPFLASDTATSPPTYAVTSALISKAVGERSALILHVDVFNAICLAAGNTIGDMHTKTKAELSEAAPSAVLPPDSKVSAEHFASFVAMTVTTLENDRNEYTYVSHTPPAAGSRKESLLLLRTIARSLYGNNSVEPPHAGDQVPLAAVNHVLDPATVAAQNALLTAKTQNVLAATAAQAANALEREEREANLPFRPTDAQTIKELSEGHESELVRLIAAKAVPSRAADLAILIQLHGREFFSGSLDANLALSTGDPLPPDFIIHKSLYIILLRGRIGLWATGCLTIADLAVGGAPSTLDLDLTETKSLNAATCSATDAKITKMGDIRLGLERAMAIVSFALHRKNKLFKCLRVMHDAVDAFITRQGAFTSLIDEIESSTLTTSLVTFTDTLIQKYFRALGDHLQDQLPASDIAQAIFASEFKERFCGDSPSPWNTLARFYSFHATPQELMSSPLWIQNVTNATARKPPAPPGTALSKSSTTTAASPAPAWTSRLRPTAISPAGSYRDAGKVYRSSHPGALQPCMRQMLTGGPCPAACKQDHSYPRGIASEEVLSVAAGVGNLMSYDGSRVINGGE